MGGSFDGAVIAVHFSEHVANLLGKKSEILWVWDGAHMTELCFRHTIKKFSRLKKIHEDLAGIAKFCRDPKINEMALELANKSTWSE